MEALRVSASDLDAYRYFMAHEEADLEALLAQLRREMSPTPAMMTGTALHKALEDSVDGTYESLSADGYTFQIDFDATLDIPAIREIKATRDYEINDCIVTLVGKVDAVHGKRVDDHKLTGRYDAERFVGSYQWRVYLDIFHADAFRWNVFEGRPSRDDHKHYRISALHPLTIHRYPGMTDDILRALHHYVDFAQIHLPEKFEPFDEMGTGHEVEN